MPETIFSQEMESTEGSSDIQTYEEIEYFARSVYPELLKLAEEISKSPSDIAINDVQSLIQRLQADKIFSMPLYERLLADAELGATLKHDINTPATTFFLHLSYLKEFTPSKPNAWQRFARSLNAFLKICPRYFLVLEDILLRKIEKSGAPAPAVPFNAVFADRALTELRNSSEMTGRVRELFGDKPSAENTTATAKPLQHFFSFDSDERVMAPTGEVMNAVFNIIRNASKVEVGAEHASCEISRVGNQMVVRVIDDGQGMSGDQLEHIFEKGTSFTGSSGLGLAGLDARLAKQQIHFFVASRKKTSQPGDAITFAEVHVYPADSEEVSRLQSLLDDRGAATVFEMRLPITVL